MVAFKTKTQVEMRKGLREVLGGVTIAHIDVQSVFEQTRQGAFQDATRPVTITIHGFMMAKPAAIRKRKKRP